MSLKYFLGCICLSSNQLFFFSFSFFPTAFSLDTEQPDYDLDSEDETFVNKLKKKMEITALQFEEMIDRLEKGSGQQVYVTLCGESIALHAHSLFIHFTLNKMYTLSHFLHYCIMFNLYFSHLRGLLFSLSVVSLKVTIY